MHTEVPLFQKIYDFYKAYFRIADHFPKKSRDVLGRKIEENIIELLQLVTNASYLGQGQKVECLKRASSRVDFLKILFRLCYEVRIIDQKKYIFMEEKLDEMGRMLGGWLKTTNRPS